MTADLVCLTLIAPRQFRQELFDYLTAQSDLVSGFTASDAAGHGATVRLSTPAERVKGHADQVLVRIVLAKPDAGHLLVRLRTAFAGSQLVYWIMPVVGFGMVDGCSTDHSHPSLDVLLGEGRKPLEEMK